MAWWPPADPPLRRDSAFFTPGCWVCELLTARKLGPGQNCGYHDPLVSRYAWETFPQLMPRRMTGYHVDA